MFAGLKRGVAAILLGVAFVAAPAASPVRGSEAAAQSQPGAYDLALLHPEVRRAVEQARAAYIRAQQAAVRARFNAPGTISRVGTGGDRYEGEGFDDPTRGFQRNGYGVSSWDDGEHHGGAVRTGNDTVGGTRVDYGVYVHANGYRYEGHWQDNRDGYGVLWDPQGNVAAQGLWRNDEVVTPLTP